MKNHELKISIQVRPMLGDLTNPVVGQQAINSLVGTCEEVIRLLRIHNPKVRLPSAKTLFASPKNKPWQATAMLVTPIALDCDAVITDLQVNVSAEMISQLPQTRRREALRRINNLFSGNHLQGVVSVGATSVDLENQDRSYPIQQGTPWGGTAIGTLAEISLQSMRLRLNRAGSADVFQTLDVDLGQHPSFIVEALHCRHILVRGFGTINGTKLCATRVDEVRRATDSELAAFGINVQLL